MPRYMASIVTHTSHCHIINGLYRLRARTADDARVEIKRTLAKRFGLDQNDYTALALEVVGGAQIVCGVLLDLSADDIDNAFTPTDSIAAHAD